MNMKKIISVVLLICLVAAMLVGCGSDTEKQTTSSSKLEKVVVSEFRHTGWIASHVAMQLGYFKEEGLDVEFAIYKDGPIAFQGMHAGDSQFCLLSAEPVLRAYDEGMESYIILTNIKNRLYMLASTPAIKDIKDLKGKTVFAGMVGSAPYSFVCSVLKQAGLDPEKDVTFVNMEYGASLAALAKGQIDACYLSIQDKAGLDGTNANILVDTTIPEQHKALYNSEYYESEIITVSKKYADANPETVQKFTNAVVRALAWMNEHTAAEIAQVALPMYEGMKLEELTAKLEILKNSYSQYGEIHEEGFEPVQRFCLEQGLIKKEIGYDNIINMKFVNAAKEKLAK